jgi:hypothetical protein
MPAKNKIVVNVSKVARTEVSVAKGNIVTSNSIPEKTDFNGLRKWWHNLLREHGKYSCCAFILLLPADIQAIKYLTEFGTELDLISGENCLVLAISEVQLMRFGFDENLWRMAINDQISNGQSIKIANLFNIKLTEFPCMVIFQDIRSPDHLIVSLQGMDAEEISQKTRSIFAIIQLANNNKVNPLIELKRQEAKKEFQKAGISIMGKLQSFAGKTFETAMEAVIQSAIKNA